MESAGFDKTVFDLSLEFFDDVVVVAGSDDDAKGVDVFGWVLVDLDGVKIGDKFVVGRGVFFDIDTPSFRVFKG